MAVPWAGTSVQRDPVLRASPAPALRARRGFPPLHSPGCLACGRAGLATLRPPRSFPPRQEGASRCTRFVFARSTYNNATNAAFEYGDAEIEHVDAAHEEERALSVRKGARLAPEGMDVMDHVRKSFRHHNRRMVFLDQLYWVPPDNADRPKVEAMAEALREKGTMLPVDVVQINRKLYLASQSCTRVLALATMATSQLRVRVVRKDPPWPPSLLRRHVRFNRDAVRKWLRSDVDSYLDWAAQWQPDLARGVLRGGGGRRGGGRGGGEAGRSSEGRGGAEGGGEGRGGVRAGGGVAGGGDGGEGADEGREGL